MKSYEQQVARLAGVRVPFRIIRIGHSKDHSTSSSVVKDVLDVHYSRYSDELARADGFELIIGGPTLSSDFYFFGTVFSIKRRTRLTAFGRKHGGVSARFEDGLRYGGTVEINGGIDYNRGTVEVPDSKLRELGMANYVRLQDMMHAYAKHMHQVGRTFVEPL